MLVTRWWGGIRVTVFNCDAQYNEGRQQHPTVITESQTHDVSNHITKHRCIEATHCTPETYTMLQVIFIQFKEPNKGLGQSNVVEGPSACPSLGWMPTPTLAPLWIQLRPLCPWLCKYSRKTWPRTQMGLRPL